MYLGSPGTEEDCLLFPRPAGERQDPEHSEESKLGLPEEYLQT